MKRGKRLTREQKIYISKQIPELECVNDLRVMREALGYLEIQNRKTGIWYLMEKKNMKAGKERKT